MTVSPSRKVLRLIVANLAERTGLDFSHDGQHTPANKVGFYALELDRQGRHSEAQLAEILSEQLHRAYEISWSEYMALSEDEKEEWQLNYEEWSNAKSEAARKARMQRANEIEAAQLKDLEAGNAEYQKPVRGFFGFKKAN